MRVALCMSEKASRTFEDCLTKMCDNHSFMTYTDTDSLLYSMQSENITFDRILFNTKFFAGNPQMDIQNITDYLRANSPDTDCILIYDSANQRPNEMRVLEAYKKTMIGPTYVTKGYPKSMVTSQDMVWLVESDISEFQDFDSYSEDDGSTDEGTYQPQVVESDYGGYDDYDDYDTYNDDYGDYSTQESNQEIYDDYDDYKGYEQPQQDFVDSSYEGVITPSQKKFVLLIGTESVPVHLIATDMAGAEINRNRRVAVVDLDEQYNRLTKCFDLNDFYASGCNDGIECMRSFHDAGAGVDLISNGLGEKITPDSVSRLVGSNILKSFDTVILACPISNLKVLSASTISACDVRIVLRGEFQEMLSAYGAVTDRDNVVGSLEDLLYETGHLYVLVKTSKEIIIDEADFHEDVDLLKRDVIWTRYFWIDEEKATIL